METVNILWTGGWDSTYRMIQLAKKNIVIQPFYLKDKGRKSIEYELKAISVLAGLINKMPSCKGRILELKIIYIDGLAEDPEISRAFSNMLSRDFFGKQYEWLARFAKQHGNLELTIHKDDKAFQIIKKYGQIKKHTYQWEGETEYFKLDHEKSEEDITRIFGNYHFPLLYSSKLEMKKHAEKNQYLHIMNHTWFCHRPRYGSSCGTCNPCTYTIEEGLSYRFTKYALFRHKRNRFIANLKLSIKRRLEGLN